MPSGRSPTKEKELNAFSSLFGYGVLQGTPYFCVETPKQAAGELISTTKKQLWAADY